MQDKPDFWIKAQKYERGWHHNCINSYGEEEKQLIYAEKMGLERSPDNKTPYRFDLEGKDILDIGGGAYSLLLKCVNYDHPVVLDPLMDSYPEWVRNRYETADIEFISLPAEELTDVEIPFDECWIYNVLEHTYDPKKVLENALEAGKIIRIFEWLDTPPSVGHPQTLRQDKLDEWLGGNGKTAFIKRGRAVGKAYFGVFRGNHYDE